MTEPKKTTARKPSNRGVGAGDKPAKKPVAKKTAAPRARAQKPVDRIIRNLRGVPVHLRLGPQRDPYRVQLNPRGQAGDTDTIPAHLVSQLQDEGVLYEFITETEARELRYGGNVYAQREQVRIERPEDTNVLTAPDVDGSRSRVDWENVRRDSQGFPVVNTREDVGAGPRYADVPGGDNGLHETLREGARRAAADDMLPEGVQFDRRVVVERVKGQ